MRLRAPWDRGGLRTYLVLIALVVSREEPRAVLWGLPLLILGTALHVYAKGCLRQNQAVAMGGPYRFVRHPFYLANLLIDLSIAVMSGRWVLVALLPVWWFLVYVPVMRREEGILTGLFPDVYPEYRKRVPRLFPFRRPLPAASGEGFSWANANIASDTALPRMLRMFAYPLLFLLVQEAKGRRLLPNAETLVLVCSLAALYLVSWEMKRHLRDGRRILPAWAGGWSARLLVAVALLVTAGLLRRPEIESARALLPVGVGLVVISVLLCAWRPRARLAEGMAVTAAVVLCELPWLAAAPLLWYGALVLDQRLEGAGEMPAKATSASAQVAAYVVALVLGLTTAMAKELVTR